MFGRMFATKPRPDVADGVTQSRKPIQTARAPGAAQPPFNHDFSKIRPGALRSRWDSFEREAIRRATNRDRSGVTQVDAGHLDRQGAGVVPALQTTLGDGQPLESRVRSEMEGTFGFDFSKVRVFDDSRAADTNDRMLSNAYTLGSNIAFGRGRYQPHTGAGRELIAHELTHVVQQRSHTSVQLNAAAPVPLDVPPEWDIKFKLNRPDPNNPKDMGSAPADVLTAKGAALLDVLVSLFRANPSLEAELEGNASAEGPDNFNQRLSELRAQYVALRIGAGRVHAAPNSQHACVPIGDGLYGCGTTHANAKVNEADRRVHVSLFKPATQTQPPTGGTKTTDLQTDTPKKDDARAKPVEQTQTTGDQSAAKPASGKNQVSLQGGVAPTAHRYLSTPGPTDPLSETMISLALAYTRQFHPDKKPGLELQIPIQVQYSIEGKKYTLGGGAQLSYVVPFGDPTDPKWQFSAYVQAVVGGEVKRGGAFQFQPSLGLQLSYQPIDWLQVGLLASPAGITAQSSGPTSFDMSGLLYIQIQTP